MYRVLKHSMYYLRIGGPRLPCKVSPWSVVVVKSIRPEIPSLLRDNFRFIFSQLLFFFNSFILVDSVHEPA